MKTKLYNWNVNDALKTPEDRAAYIEAAMAENNPEFLTVALGDVAKAEGMTFSNVEDAISYLHTNV